MTHHPTRGIFSTTAVLALAALLLSALAGPARAVVIPTAPVGNAGNAPDPLTGSLYGAVAYDYRIGTTEVTIGQYTEFLNAVAKTDTYALYNPALATTHNVARIARAGSSGSYSYSVIDSPNMPVTFVSWGDAVRFANWMHNGQPTGPQDASTTEDGAYTLNGATTDAALHAVSRNPGAIWFIPTENEWYKAAYHKNDGSTGNYWAYPTSTDTVPYSAKPPGSDAPTPSNTANIVWNDSIANGYDDGFAATGLSAYFSSHKYLTDVGAYVDSVSPYGTYDQGGNVLEWTETFVLRGGAWGHGRGSTGSSIRDSSVIGWGTYENANLGFRMATVPIPEPSSAALAIVGCAMLCWWRARRK